MATRAGLHIMDAGVDDWGALSNWLDKLHSSAHLVLNNVAFAGHLAQQLDATIISRKMHPQENSFWKWATAKQAVDYVGNDYDILNQVLNEPGDYDSDMVDWMCDVVIEGSRQVQRIGIPAYATGNPHQEAILSGKYDRLLRLLSGTNHGLILHEYFTTNYDGIFEPAIPWWVGRYNFYLDRCKAIGIKPPKMYITESGRDVGGGKGKDGDGWRNAKFPDGRNWSDADYLGFYKTQLNKYPSYIPLILFCYGRGWSTLAFSEGEWHSFDGQQSSIFLNGLVQYNRTVQITEALPMVPLPLPANTPTYAGKVISVPSKYPVRNLRDRPEIPSTVLDTVELGERLEYAEARNYPSSLSPWYWVKKENGVWGWTQKVEGFEIAPVEEQLPPLSSEDLYELSGLHAKLAETHTTIAAVFMEAYNRSKE